MVKEIITSGQKVKPIDMVEVRWIGSKFHENGATSMVHRVQAEKLINDKKAELVKGGKNRSKGVNELNSEGSNV